LILDPEYKKLPELTYFSKFPLHLTRDRIKGLLQGCEELIELILGEPINVRKLRDYHPDNFNRSDPRLRQMFHVNEINQITKNNDYRELTIPQSINFTLYQALCNFIASPPNLFFCVDQCENIYAQLFKFKRLDTMSNLTRDQIIAVLLYFYECSKDYKDSLSHYVNKALIIRDISYDLYLCLLRSAFNNLPVIRQTVFRGISPTCEEASIFIDPIKNITGASVFQWLTYSRCTSLAQAKTYATINGVILEIENAPVLSLVKFGNIISNDELLLSPNARYKVIHPLYRIPGGYDSIKLQSIDESFPF